MVPTWNMVFTDELFQKALKEYGSPTSYWQDFYMLSADKRREIQDIRLREQVRRAANVPMYKRIWKKNGFDPATFRGLEDLRKIPIYTICDIRESLEIAPPYGDYQGTAVGKEHMGNRLYFSGGTTGAPRPTIYTVWDRVIGALLGARQFYHHGLRPGDVVLNSFAYSTHNGAFIIDETLWYWLGCVPITTSTGQVTSSVKQLQLAKDYGAVTIMTTADYLLRLREVADEMGLMPSDFNFKFFTTIGDTKSVEKAWGVPVYEFYAFHEVQVLAIECMKQSGMHVFEDAFIVEVVDHDTGEPVPDGELGDLVVTCLYKTGSPQIRFNLQDMSSILPGICDCGNDIMRISSLAGRSDNMVKLRGLNVWPEAIGGVLKDFVGRPVEYFCVAYRQDGQDQMRAFVELDRPEMSDHFNDRAAELLKDKMGVKIEVQQVALGNLAALTGAGIVTKLKRFKDERALADLSPEIRKVYR